MTRDQTHRDAWRRNQAKRLRRQQAGAGVDTNGGISSVLEPGIARVETHLEHLRSDLDALKTVPTKIAVLEERVTHLPSKGWMTGALVTALAIITGLIALSEKLHALLK